MITIGQDGGLWVWHNKRPGMTWTSRQRFATLSEATRVGRSVAKCGGDIFVEPVDEIAPEVDIWEDDDPMTWDAIVPIPEVPVEYTAEDDAIAAEGLMHSLYWAGAIE